MNFEDTLLDFGFGDLYLPIDSKQRSNTPIIDPVVLIGNPVLSPKDTLELQYPDSDSINVALARFNKAVAYALLIDHVSKVKPEQMLARDVDLEQVVLTDLKSSINRDLINSLKKFKVEPEAVLIEFEGVARKDLWAEYDERKKAGKNVDLLCTSDGTSCALGRREFGHYNKGYKIAYCGAVHAFVHKRLVVRAPDAKSVVTVMHESEIGSDSGFIRHSKLMAESVNKVFADIQPESRSVVVWCDKNGQLVRFDSQQ